jgi:hypothetical protein
MKKKILIGLGIAAGVVAVAMLFYLLLTTLLGKGLEKVEQISGVDFPESVRMNRYEWNKHNGVTEISAEMYIPDELVADVTGDLTDAGFVWENDFLTHRAIAPYTAVAFKFTDLKSEKTHISFYATDI